jgi:hypothetical protein
MPLLRVAPAVIAAVPLRSRFFQTRSRGGPRDARHLTRLKHLMLADQAEGAPWAPFFLPLEADPSACQGAQSTRSTVAEGERATMDAQRAVDGGADGARRKDVAAERRREATGGGSEMSHPPAIKGEH